MGETEGARVLVVDDIEENLKVLSETLVQAGYKPLQAKSGERAIQIAAVAKPDLILLDIKMPGMDGFETIRLLKEDPATAGIPVIFISALNQIEDKVRGFQAGAAYALPALRKPGSLLAQYCGRYAAAFDDPAVARAIADSQYKKGARILFHAAGASGRGLFDAARAAVFLHGRAGDQAADEKSEPGIIAGDLIEELPYAFQDIIPR